MSVCSAAMAATSRPRRDSRASSKTTNSDHQFEISMQNTRAARRYSSVGGGGKTYIGEHTKPHTSTVGMCCTISILLAVLTLVGGEWFVELG